jgi:zinc transport system ATP-binding protein
VTGDQWLVASELSFSYDGKIVLQNISFAIEQGAFFGIIGANGSGKSTLLKGILGLKKPSSGKILINSDIKRHGFGYLAQKTPIHKYFPASVGEVIMSGLLLKKGISPFFNTGDKNAAQEKMALLGIEHLSKRRFGELSGGQQQRTLLARALCVSDKTLVLDEPASNLDESSHAKFFDIIRQLHKKGATIIMVSHNVDYIKENASAVLRL